MIAFLAIFLIGYFIAKVVGRIVGRLLKVGFDRAVERGGIKKAFAHAKFEPSDILAKVVFYTLLLVVLQMAFGVFGSNPISDLLHGAIAYLPKVIVAMVIIVLASAIGAAARELISASLGKLSYGKALANAAGIAVMVFGVFAALNELQIAPAIVNGLFYALLAIVVGSAVIAIGGGGIIPMRDRWKNVLAKYDEEKPKIQEAAKGSKERITEQAQQRVEHLKSNGAASHSLPAPQALILLDDVDAIDRVGVTVVNRVLGPVGEDARLESERGAIALHSEERFDNQWVHPSGRAGRSPERNRGKNSSLRDDVIGAHGALFETGPSVTSAGTQTRSAAGLTPIRSSVTAGRSSPSNSHGRAGFDRTIIDTASPRRIRRDDWRDPVIIDPRTASHDRSVDALSMASSSDPLVGSASGNAVNPPLSVPRLPARTMVAGPAMFAHSGGSMISTCTTAGRVRRWRSADAT